MLSIHSPVALLVIAEPPRTDVFYLSWTVRNSICADTLQQTLKFEGLLTDYRMCAFAENHKSSRELDSEIYNILFFNSYLSHYWEICVLKRMIKYTKYISGSLCLRPLAPAVKITILPQSREVCSQACFLTFRKILDLNTSKTSARADKVLKPNWNQ